MKRCLAAVLAVTILFVTFFIQKRPFTQTEPEPHTRTEIRAVWINYMELSMLNETERNESVFRKKAREMVANIRKSGLNTVFFHAHPCSDAFYRSDIFPFSAYLTGTQGEDPQYDPLAIFCEYAEKANLSVHAWINPFRIRSANNTKPLAESNPARRMQESTLCIRGGLYYNPADPAVHDLILRCIRELLERYTIDGIHIDDYFYPTTDASADEKFFKMQSEKDLETWRRDTISGLIHAMYTTVKSYGEDKIFSISPALNIAYDQNTLYADVTRWASRDGYCDWLIPQVYVGFEHETFPFEQVIADWKAITEDPNVRLIIGLSAYKCDTRDPYAGTGCAEWQKNADILSRQCAFIRSDPATDGFSLYSYTYVFGKNMSHNANKEIQLLTSML